ncbi:hypothetical protein PMZ80_002098 [Knufia obscura]|uniref:Uncharacterized protein n=2 Tax=Knufia TaxID=430999 RepID=A0AAN8EES1_9EURO|nr:hypothetical protein PMZ80_002098 [Knufia obscura]KAK5953913.1 hypothetical protein OHC33_005184 [Knufia fluminis]
MHFPKLSQLQSRFAVSLGGTLVLILIYLSINRPSFAYAAELDSRIPPDHNHPFSPDSFENGGFDEEEDFASVEHLREITLDVADIQYDQHRGTQDLGAKEYEEGELYVSSNTRKVAGELRKRAPDGVNSLSNNAPQNMNIELGVTQNWMFSQDEIEGPHSENGVGFPSDASTTGNMSDDGPFRRELSNRQSGTPIWITINVCLQPMSNTSTNEMPPQIQLFYSASDDIQKPGATSDGMTGTRIDVEGGYGIIQSNATGDVYIGVTAPNTTNFQGMWNYEIAASNDAPYHFYSNETDLLFVDGDNHAALLVTPDLTDAISNSTTYQQWMETQAPYGMFAHDQKNTSILGVSRSYCGLRNNARIAANVPGITNNNVGTMTNRGLGGAPKEQFYISALNASSEYWGFLAMTGNSTATGAGVIGGGGRVWSNMTFSTKANDNCALMYNLSFCSEVAYAVPSNPDKFSPLDGLADLAAVYDSYAAQMYQYFNYSLQQIPCNTTASAQYSLARNCDDCARAYKQWLCAVTIPRCEDWGNNAPYLAQRNMAQNFPNGSTPSWVSNSGVDAQVLLNAVQSNSSRNSQIIDDKIQPGPYKEVLPCIDLCYDLVQSCPAALGFGCPQGKYQNMSYGVRDPDPGILSCSYLGAAFYLSDGVRDLGVPSMDKMWVSLIITIVFLFC